MSDWKERATDESGTAVIEFIWLAIVLLIPLIYLVLCLARLQAGSYAVAQAARESGRAFVTASEETDAQARAHAAAEIAFEDQGFAGTGDLSVTCTATPCLTAGGSVLTEASVSVPLPLVPEFLRGSVPLQIPVSASQVAPVPKYEAR